jgi:hypothetical protein
MSLKNESYHPRMLPTLKWNDDGEILDYMARKTGIASLKQA